MQVNGNSTPMARHRVLVAAAASAALAAAATAAPTAAAATPSASQAASVHAGAPAPRQVRPAEIRRAAVRPPAALARLTTAEAAAAARAKATHRTVPGDAATTETSATLAHPNGTFTMSTYAAPVRVKVHGTWRPVSAALHRTASGAFSPSAVPSGLALSGGGRGPLAVLTSLAGGRLALTFPVPLPAPVITGDTATYRSVFPGVDLRVSATTLGGISTTLVIHNAAAARNPKLRTLRLAVATRGLHLSADAAGNLAATGPRGRTEFQGATPMLWDSPTRGAAGPGPAAARAGTTAQPAGDGHHAPVVRHEKRRQWRRRDSAAGSGRRWAPLSVRVSGRALTLTPAARLLSRSAAYPAYISSSITSDVTQCQTTQDNNTESCVSPVAGLDGAFVETQQACPANKFYGQQQGEEVDGVDYYGNGAGYNGFDSCIGAYRAYYQFDTSNLDPSMHIISAVLTAWDNYGAQYSCPSDKISLDWSGEIGRDTDWANQPGDAAGDSRRTATVKGGPNPGSTCAHGQTPQWTIQYAMIAAAANSYPTMTFMFTGDESPGGDLIRLGDNPDIITTFDRDPKAPADLETLPIAPHATPGGGAQACDPSNSMTDPVWLGGQDVSQPGGALSATIAPNVADEPVRAGYTVWDDMQDGAHLSQPDSNYYPTSGTASSTTDTPLGFSLEDGHFYGWTADSEVSGIPVNTDGPFTTPAAGNCYFAVDTTDPTPPAVSSSAFPAAGTWATGDVAGDSGTFKFSSTDPIPTAYPCTTDNAPVNCLASGVYEFEYSLDQPLPSSPPTATGCPTMQSPGVVLASNRNSLGDPSTATSCPLTVSLWGTHTLYVDAFDAAGNVSQAQYNFYVPWQPGSGTPTPGDINGDGIPDLLGTTGSDLALFPGDQDPSATPTEIAGPQAASPGGEGDAWSNFLITHRDSFSNNGTVDDLFALHETSAGNFLYVYPNGGGSQDQFDNAASATLLNGNWDSVTQILAPGDAWLPASQQTENALPSLFTVQDDGQLWLYPGEAGPALGQGIEVGTGFSGMTLIAPGDVGGSLTLWARDDATGTLWSYPISIVHGQPTLNPLDPGTPITAGDGTQIGTISLPASAYPTVASPGPLDNSSYPGLYAEATSGTSPEGACTATSACLYYYPGQSTSGGAPPLSSNAIFVGKLSAEVSQLS
jgi:hypothetical protein